MQRTDVPGISHMAWSFRLLAFQSHLPATYILDCGHPLPSHSNALRILNADGQLGGSILHDGYEVSRLMRAVRHVQVGRWYSMFLLP